MTAPVSPLNLLCDWPPDWPGWGRRVRQWFQRLTSWIVLGLLAQAAIGVWIQRSGVVRDVNLRHGFQSPVLAFELARSAPEAREILQGDPQPMSRVFHRDWFFIGAYGSTFVLLGLLLRRRHAGLGWCLVGLALAVASADLVENGNAVSVLRGEDAPVRAMRLASQAKWLLLGPVCLLTAQLCRLRYRPFLFQVCSGATVVVLVLAGVSFLMGILYEPLWEFAMTNVGNASLGLLLLLTLWPEEFDVR